ncbi:unnamed protein product [Cladocopium goreaui]|uniref:non-specific serine/threonine protein kinase n=1 Tax=Cladocopium goreaui TaxID=2562237 RepID=A0A9P1GNR1_9DINO|nr:unnamed protein product [Cladocopium goreaui]
MVRARRGSLCICLSTFGVQLLSFSWAFCGTWYPHFLPASQCPVQCTGRRWRSLLRVKIGDELNGFQLDEPLGAGAFGTTWRARATNQSDLKTLNLAEGQEVALKLIKLQDGWSTLDKFEREASVLQRLRHVAIPRYYGTVQREGRDGLDLGLVSQLVEGATLEEEVTKGRWVATPENLRALAETLLEVCMHMASFAPPVVHRDIKPANILLEFDNSSQRTEPKIYLVDFGSAVLGSGTRTAAGTFGYMAPESFGNSFTPKSDLYGVGASLLFAATGLEPGSLPVDRLQVKFEKALVGTVWASRSRSVGNSSVHPKETWLPQLLQRLLAPAPEDRFSSASEALTFLRSPPPLATRDPASNGAVLPREAVSMEPPRGSKIVVKEGPGELRILFPPPSLSLDFRMGTFATAWTVFTGVWTAGVVSAGAPIMALFSLPFWNVGFTMLKDTFQPLIRGALELRIERDRWTISKANGKQLDSGKTAKLQCFLEGPEMGQSYLVLQEGIERPLKQGGLTQTEAECLEALISSYTGRK